MSSNLNPSPWQLVGLPDPDAIELEDPALEEAYRKFCSSLTILEGGKAIAAGEYLWVFAGWEPNFASLRLMTALFHPNRHQLKKIWERTKVNPAYASQWKGVLKHDIEVARAFKEMKAFRAQPDFRKLTRNTLPARTLLKHTSVLLSAPGMSWWSTIEASVYNKDWAILMAYGDEEDNVWSPSPMWPGSVAWRAFPET